MLKSVFLTDGKPTSVFYGVQRT